MAQQMKTDWMLFATTRGDGVLRAGDGLQRVVGDGEQNPRYHSSTYFVVRQAIWLVLALALMMFLKRHATIAKLQTPGCGVRGHRRGDHAAGRWCTFSIRDIIAGCGWGCSSIQPSEFAKPALVMFLAYFVAHRARGDQQPVYAAGPR